MTLKKSVLRGRGEGGFVPAVVMEGMILLAVLGIVTAIAIPQCAAYRKRKREQKALETIDRYYENIVGVAAGTLEPGQAAPVFGEKYVLKDIDGRTILIWPDPKGWYRTRPRFVRLGNDVVFQQDLPPLEYEPGKWIQFPDGLRIADQGDRVVIQDWREKSVQLTFFKKSLGAEYIHRQHYREPEPIKMKKVLAAVPVKKEVSGLLIYRIVYREGGAVRHIDALEFDPRGLKAISMVDRFLFPVPAVAN